MNAYGDETQDDATNIHLLFGDENNFGSLIIEWKCSISFQTPKSVEFESDVKASSMLGL